MPKLRTLLWITVIAPLTLIVGRVWPMGNLWVTASSLVAVLLFVRALVGYFEWRMRYRRRVLKEISHDCGAA